MMFDFDDHKTQEMNRYRDEVDPLTTTAGPFTVMLDQHPADSLYDTVSDLPPVHPRSQFLSSSLGYSRNFMMNENGSGGRSVSADTGTAPPSLRSLLNLNNSTVVMHHDDDLTDVISAPSFNSTSSILSNSSAKSTGSNSKCALQWISGYCTKLGPRSTNEDRLISIPSLVKDILCQTGRTLPGGSKQGYFAVYDGHCGDHASSYLQRELHLQICNHPSFLSNIQAAITESCAMLDKEVLVSCSSCIYCQVKC
jgi:hypothetical protein